MKINKLIIVCYKCCNIHIHVSSLTKQLLNNNNKRSTITIDITRYYMYMYDIGICVLFKKFFLSLIFEKKTNQRIFIHFYYYEINIVWSIIFEKNHEISFVQYRLGVNEIEIHVCSRFFIRWLKIDRQKRCTRIFFANRYCIKVGNGIRYRDESEYLVDEFSF